MYKLIRDNIPTIIEAQNKICDYAVIQNDELYHKLLIAKLVEEVQEYLETPSLEELADILLVVNTIAEDDSEVFKQIYDAKLLKNGGFKNKYIGFFQDKKEAE